MRRNLFGSFVSIAASSFVLIAVSMSSALGAPPAYNWTGIYFGGNAGYGWGSSNASTTTVFTALDYWNVASVPQVNTAGTTHVHPDGFVGGGQLGYNYQISSWIVGAEIDFQSFHLSGSQSGGAAFTCCAGSFAMTQSVSTDWLFTARGSLGWAADNWLFYGTGGLAMANLRHQSTYSDTFGAAESVIDTATKTGWVVGAGAEYAFLQRWTAKIEYLYVNFGSLSSTSLLGPTAVTGACNCTPMFHNADLTANVVRLGVNYNFQ